MGLNLSVSVDASGALSGRATQAVPWWSFTKTVIAIACFRAAETRQLDLHAPAWPRGRSVLAALRHEARLPDYGGWPDYHAAVATGAKPWPAAEVIRRGLDMPPPESWTYSNIGYALVAQRLSEHLAQPLDQILRDLVLGPAGADRARLVSGPEDLADVAGIAPGYHPNWVYHGLLAGPLEDATRLVWRLAAGELLAGEPLDKMLRATLLPRFSTPGRPEAAYGAGVMLPGARTGSGLLGHSGSGPGSDLAVYARRAPWGVTAAAAFSDDGSDVEGWTLERLSSDEPDRASSG